MTKSRPTVELLFFKYDAFNHNDWAEQIHPSNYYRPSVSCIPLDELDDCPYKLYELAHDKRIRLKPGVPRTEVRPGDLIRITVVPEKDVRLAIMLDPFTLSEEFIEEFDCERNPDYPLALVRTFQVPSFNCSGSPRDN